LLNSLNIASKIIHIAPHGKKRKRVTVLHFPDDISVGPRPEYKSMLLKRID
jgi:hypothetical protein